jgi:hypothetical protein
MDVAAELRELAAEIEAITRDSRVCGIAWEQVRALVDYLTLRARVIELEARLPPGANGSSPIKSPGGGSENIEL